MKTVLEISKCKITVTSGLVSYDFVEISGHTGITLEAGNFAVIEIPLGEKIYTYSDGAIFSQEALSYRVVEIE